MANLSQPLGLNTPFFANAASSATGLSAQETKDRRNAMAAQLILELNNPDSREKSITELCKNRELLQLPDLAPMLWHSFGTVAALLQEITSIYPMLSPPNLTYSASNRVCNALALLQILASHPDIRAPFISAHIPLYLYPFLNTTSQAKPFEYLRLTSLGVIGALVKEDDTEVVNFLLATEIIPLCLRTMETNTDLTQTVATFIVEKILRDDVGLAYICATAERFYAVGQVLRTMVLDKPSIRLLKHIIRCYLRLSDNSRACDALKNCLPDVLRDMKFINCLRDDPTIWRCLTQLLHNINNGGNVNSMPRGPAMVPGRIDHFVAD